LEKEKNNEAKFSFSKASIQLKKPAYPKKENHSNYIQNFPIIIEKNRQIFQQSKYKGENETIKIFSWIICSSDSVIQIVRKNSPKSTL
jgi:hypothetical protein